MQFQSSGKKVPSPVETPDCACISICRAFTSRVFIDMYIIIQGKKRETQKKLYTFCVLSECCSWRSEYELDRKVYHVYSFFAE